MEHMGEVKQYYEASAEMAPLSSEGVAAPCEPNLIQPEGVLQAWLDFCIEVCEKEEFLAFGEHYLSVKCKA